MPIQGSPKPILEHASDAPFITEHRLSYAFPGVKTKLGDFEWNAKRQYLHFYSIVKYAGAV